MALPRGISIAGARIVNGSGDELLINPNGRLDVNVRTGPNGGQEVIQDTAADLLMTAYQGGIWDLRNISGDISLPAGAATAAKQLADGHNVTVDNTSDNIIPVSGDITLFNSSGDEFLVDGDGRAEIIDASQLIPKKFDYIGIAWSGDNIVRAIYKTGGASGEQQAQLDMTYSGDKVLTVTRT